MKLNFLILTLVSLFCLGCETSNTSSKDTRASTTVLPKATLPDELQLRYDERMSFANGENYNPFAMQVLESALIKEFQKQWENGEKVESLTFLRNLLDEYPCSLKGNWCMLDACVELSKSKNESEDWDKLLEVYKERASSLIESITFYNTGKSYEDAFKVINIGEEYTLLQYLGYSPVSQELRIHKKVPYDVIKVFDVYGVEDLIYFEISEFYHGE